MGHNLRRGCDSDARAYAPPIDVASYQVESRPGGPVGRLEVRRPDAAPPDLRLWLADQLDALRARPGRHDASGVAWFTGDVAVDQGRPTLARIRFGPHPAPDDWPRLPLRDLLAAAAHDLRSR